MTCCSLLVALTLSMGYGDIPDSAMGSFATPMFLRGEPVWITRISRRQLRLTHDKKNRRHHEPETDVAVILL